MAPELATTVVGRGVAEPSALPPEAQAGPGLGAPARAMLNEQLEAWIEQRATAPTGLSPEEIAALQLQRQPGPTGGPGVV